MTMTNTSYDTVTSLFCGVEFQSVRVEGTDYYPVTLLPVDPNGINGFQVRQDEKLQDVKRLLGKAFKSVKVKTSKFKVKIACIDHATLVDLIDTCAFEKSSVFCRMLLKASVDVQLRMSNDYAYGKEEEVQYYVELAALRVEGIRYRRMFTDVIKLQKELGYSLDYGHMTILVYTASDLLDKFHAWKQVYTTKATRAKNPFRGTLNQLELEKLNNFELRAAERALAKKIPIIQAIQDTSEFFS